MIDRKSVPCRGCAAPILFVVTKAGKFMPVDVKPLSVVVLEENGRDIKTIVNGHMPHHATCPNAAEFRGKVAK